MEQRKPVQSRVLCALLALVLACGLLPAWGGVQQAYASEKVIITYLKNSGSTTQSKKTSVTPPTKIIVAGEEIDIPDTIDSFAVPDPMAPAGYKSYGYTLDTTTQYKTFTPVFKPISYTITYNGCSNASSLMPKNYTIETENASLPTPTKPYSIFKGWQNSEGVTVTFIAKGTTGDIALTATWEDDSAYSYSTAWYNTTDTSFTISTPAELIGLAKIVLGDASGITKDTFEGKTVSLANDLDLSSYSSWSGFSWNDNQFKGVFDGKSHTVTLNINSTQENASLVGYLGESGSVQNLITVGSVTSNTKNVAGIAGSTGASAVIQNCENRAAITTTVNGTAYASGICGLAGANTTVSNCSNEGAITARQGSYVSGIASETSNGKYDNVYNKGAVTGYNYVAGIISNLGTGNKNVSANNIFNAGKVSALSDSAQTVNPIACEVLASSGTRQDSQLTNWHYDKQISGCEAAESVATGHNTADMQTKAFVTTMGNAFKASFNDYPVLSWQTAKEGPSVSLSSDATNLKVGQEFTVNVNMKNITPAVQATLDYSDNLELVKVEAGSALTGDEVSFEYTDTNCLFSFVANEGTIDGTVAVATFKCKSAGDVSVGLKDVLAFASGNLSDEAAAVDAPETWKATVGLAGIAGDVNNSGKLNIVDAQIVYDMGNNQYAEDSAARTSLLARWGAGATYAMVEAIANVNSDDKVDSADAFAIQYAIHYGKFPPATSAA